MESSPQRRKLKVDLSGSAASEVRTWLWALGDTRRRTLQVIGNLPQTKLDRTLREAGNSIGTLLYHIAVIEADWLYSEVRQEPFPQEILALFPNDVRLPDGRLTPVKGLAMDDHLARLEKVRRALLGTFEAMPLEDFRRERRLPDYDVTPEWVLHHLIQHEAGHRHQIAAILGAGPA